MRQCDINLRGWLSGNDPESENCVEHRVDMRTEPVCAGGRVVLRVADGDGVGCLRAVEMVKYTAKG